MISISPKANPNIIVNQGFTAYKKEWTNVDKK